MVEKDNLLDHIYYLFIKSEVFHSNYLLEPSVLFTSVKVIIRRLKR